MKLLSLLLGLSLLVAPAQAAPLDDTHADDHGGAAAQAADDAHGEVDRAGDSSLFMELFAHLTPHPVTAVWWGGDKGLGFVKPYAADEHGDPLHGTPEHPVAFHSPGEFKEHYSAAFNGGSGFMIYNINTIMWFAVLLLLAIFVPMAKKASTLAGKPPRGTVFGMFEATILFVRNDMVYSVMGKHHGQGFVPLFLTQFFFILMMNILGLMPLGPLGGTATANLAVTAALALTTFIVINAAGIKEFGFAKHWANFAPHGVPAPVAIFIAVLEIILMLVKPAALMIRLFANLTAGHLIVLGLFGLVYFFGSYAIGAPFALMAIAIYCLELFVCFVQAYIFTYLSIVFIGAAVHPEH